MVKHIERGGGVCGDGRIWNPWKPAEVYLPELRVLSARGRPDPLLRAG